MLSKTQRKGRFDGVERADSLTWNPHKLMGTTLQCAAFHTKHEGVLAKCNSMNAEYLFMKDKFYDTSLDTGNRVIQCGRHNDVFKLWLQWRARGDLGFEHRMDRMMEVAAYQVKQLKERSDKFHLLMEPEFTNVCFWYIPKRLRGVPHSPEKEEQMGMCCPKIKERMMKAGSMMLGYTKSGNIPNFWRSIVSSEGNTEKEIDFILDEIDRLGEDL